MKRYWLINTLTLLFFACSKKNEQDSKVVVDYRGYSDTTVALLYGKISNLENQPLSNVQIKFSDSTYVTISDSTGSFEIYTTNAIYDVFLSHVGYQTVLLKGYESDSDQYTRIDVQLSPFKKDTLTINASKPPEER